MFYELILKNSKRSRKENGLFFSSLIISIVAFYIILSISNQDVMIFLKKMESDAVDKLFMLVPVFYVMTLGILFFLIYFACKYQLERRRHEFGIYLMLGMKRSRLFTLLLAEDLAGSIFALLIGLPVAVLLSEIISLVTAKTVGMGIIGHRFSVSLSGVIFTVAGFLLIKLPAFLILSAKISRQEIGALLADSTQNSNKSLSVAVYILAASAGLILLAAAYILAIGGLAWKNDKMMFFTMLSGLTGTILLFYGMRIFIEMLIKTGKSNKKLRIFNFRQIQENVVRQSASMAISSILILAALCCFGAGIGIAGKNTAVRTNNLDYTFCVSGNVLLDKKSDANEKLKYMDKILEENNLDEYFSALLPLRTGHIRTTDEFENVFIMDSVMTALEKMPQSTDRDVLLNNLSYADYPYLISLSDYNGLLEAAGKPAITLHADEAAVFRSTEAADSVRNEILNEILLTHPRTQLDGSTLYLTGEVQTGEIVTDMAITFDFALILPDEQFMYYTQGEYDIYLNAVLNEDLRNSKALMNVYMDINSKLDALNLKEMSLEYESYLQNMGRQLFYSVAASFITSYLAVIFLVVANTVMGVQFLMNQRKTGRRYKTLVHLGAEYETLCRSARKQINWFIGLPVAVAAAGSIFGVKALFSGILTMSAKANQGEMLIISAAMILFLIVVEYIYMTVIKRSSDKYLLTLMEPQREE